MLPDITGPKPLLLPATATNTVGIPSPVGRKTFGDKQSPLFSTTCFHGALSEFTAVFAVIFSIPSHGTNILCPTSFFREISSKKSYILKSQLCLPDTAEISISYSASEQKSLTKEEVLVSFIENIAINLLASLSVPLLKSETVHLEISVLTMVTTFVVSQVEWYA